MTKGSPPSTVRATHPGTQGRTSFSIPLGIEGKDAPERRAAPVIELFQVDIVQEWSRMDVNLVFVQAGEILQKAQSAACAGATITR
jgi:hypothetical protein